LAIQTLKDKKLAFEENGAIWLDTSDSGDDKNRVLIRDDGRPTYFASDVAYHKNKIDRGFDKLINVWGADHHGYIKRIEASMDGLGFDKNRLDVQLVQFANLFKEGKKVKMSTRSGEFYSLKDLIQDIGTDAARFYYLSKQADQHLDFDLDLAHLIAKRICFITFSMLTQEYFLYLINTKLTIIICPLQQIPSAMAHIVSVTS